MQSFEAKASDMGVKISRYHCDIGRFADNTFRAHCIRARIIFQFAL